MYIRSLPELTVSDLLEEVSAPLRTLTVPSNSIQVRCAEGADDHIRIGDELLPYTGAGVLALGGWLDIPSKFLTRLDPDLLTHLLNTMLNRKDADVAVSVGDTGVMDVFAPELKRIDPSQVLEIAGRVVGTDAQVVEWQKENQSYSFEVISDVRSPVSELDVNDIAHGGLRFGQDGKHGLAPWVQPYIYRLVCTNGMEVPDHTLAIKLRGNTLEEVLEELEEAAQIAFTRVESDIEAFYAMKHERVQNPERTLNRMANEYGIADRPRIALLDSLGEYLDENGELSSFDLVNAITNRANDPALAGRFNARRKLEQVGGHITTDHPTRCRFCSSRLSE